MPGSTQGNGQDRDLEDLIEAWWSVYCPSCDGRYPASQGTCPEDGSELRHTSLSFPSLLAAGKGAWDEQVAGASMGPEKEPPKLLGGKWRTGEKLSSGSFGAFHAGEHHILGMKVGIKVLRTRYTSTAEGRRLFHEEAMRVSLLHHPSIVAVFDYGDEGGVPYLVMEYLEGKPLHHLLLSRLLDMDVAVDVICQVTRALAYAHSGSRTGGPLVHLDLKPEHIFLERIGRGWHAKVIDFGIAEIVEAQGGPGPTNGTRVARGASRVAGTLPYMAPERFRGIADPRSDLYSLGVILYEAIAGKQPFKGTRLGVVLDEVMDRKKPLSEDTLEEILRLHETEVAKPPSRLRPGASSRSLEKLDNLVLWTLAKAPEDRPESAEALLQALEEWKTVREKEVRESSPRQRAMRWLARIAAVALPVLALAYWGPGEWIEHRMEILVLAETPVAAHRIAVHGFGYEEAPVLLEIDFPGRTEQLQVRGSFGPEEIQFHWPSRADIEAELGRELDEGNYTFPARLLVKGRLARNVRSEDFVLELDYKRPEIKGIERARLAGETLLAPKPAGAVAQEFTVMASEELSAAFLDEEPAALTAGRPTHATFQVRAGAGDAKLKLVDLAGNAGTRTLAIRWLEPLRVASPPSVVLTDEDSLRVSIEVEGEPRKLCIRHADEILFDEAGPSNASLTFDLTSPAESTLVVRTLTVEAWSPFTEKDGLPDLSETIVLKHLDRDLRVTAVERDGPPAFRVLEAATGTEIEAGQVIWPSTVTVRHETSEQELEVPFDPTTGELRLAGNLGGLKGKFACTLVARDPYENESPPFSHEFFFPAPPQIHGFRLAGALGSRRLPLHRPDCSCRPATGQPVVLDADVSYSDAFEMAIHFIDTVNGASSSLSFTPKEKGFSLSQEDLLRRLRPGRNILELEVSDPGARKDLRASETCEIFYEDFELTVYPENGAIVHPDEKDEVPLTITVNGATVESISIDGEAAERKGRDRFEARIRVGPLGGRVQIVAHLEHGADHEETRTYDRRPASGWRYGFRLKSLDLELLFHHSSAGSYWFTPDDAWEQLCKAFGESHPPDGATFSVADRVRRRIEAELLGAGWIRRDTGVHFPTRSQIQSLWRSERIRVAGAGSRREWLSTEADLIPSWDALYAEIRADSGVVPRGAARDREEHACPFRIVIPYDQESELKPGTAERAEPEGGEE